MKIKGWWAVVFFSERADFENNEMDSAFFFRLGADQTKRWLFVFFLRGGGVGERSERGVREE